MRPRPTLRPIAATLVAAFALHVAAAVGAETVRAGGSARELRAPSPLGEVLAVVGGSRLPLAEPLTPLRLGRRDADDRDATHRPVVTTAATRPRPAFHARSRPVRLRLPSSDDPVPD